MARAIGIDLGTTYTVVATIEAGRPRIIPNAEGQHLTPSVVAFIEGDEPLVGQGAARQAVANPDGTVFSIKRRMGSHAPLVVGGKEHTPQEISSFILRKVVADAQEYLSERITHAVITVPAYFNDRQRQATKEAGALAGLELLRIINEPTSAALAYGLQQEEAHTVLVWDLGGGTFDVSILELGDGIFEVRAVSGDTWLGGDDFDRRVMDYLAHEYRKARGADFPQEAAAKYALRALAERAKIDLTSSPVTSVQMPVLGSPRSDHVALQMTREQLVALTKDLLQRMVIPTEQALADAGLTPPDINRLILVGGATRMPMVRELARTLFGQEPYRYLDPDEVVALGAAIQAGVLLGLVDKVLLLDVLPLSLGVETQGGLLTKIISRNTPLPASGARIFTTAADYQTSLDVHILQGERALALDDISLGRFQLSGIPLAARGTPKVEVTFDADVDGIIHVAACDLLSDNEVKVKLASTKSLDRQEIASLAEDASQRAEQDRARRRQIEGMNRAQSLIAAAEMALAQRASSPADDPCKRGIAHAMARLKEAMELEAYEDVEACNTQLQQILRAASRQSADATALGRESPQ